MDERPAPTWCSAVSLIEPEIDRHGLTCLPKTQKTDCLQRRCPTMITMICFESGDGSQRMDEKRRKTRGRVDARAKVKDKNKKSTTVHGTYPNPRSVINHGRWIRTISPQVFFCVATSFAEHQLKKYNPHVESMSWHRMHTTCQHASTAMLLYML